MEAARNVTGGLPESGKAKETKADCQKEPSNKPEKG